MNEIMTLGMQEQTVLAEMTEKRIQIEKQNLESKNELKQDWFKTGFKITLRTGLETRYLLL